MNFADVKARCHGRWEGILIACGVPEGLVSGKNQPCPFCKGTDRFRFTDHEGDGWYYCNQCGSGDGIAFISRVLGIGIKEAAEKSLASVGHSEVRAVRARAWENWRKGSHPIRRQDPAALYLGGRGLKRCSDRLRFNPGIWASSTDSFVAAMIAHITSPENEVVGWHATFIERNGNGWVKAKIDRPKRQMKTSARTISGGAIRLADPKRGMICVAEGIETSLAVTEIESDPCWSLMNTSCLKSFQPPVGISEVRIFADNDANFRGQEAAYKLASRLHSEGLTVSVRMPVFQGDYLDVLNSSR